MLLFLSTSEDEQLNIYLPKL